MIIIYITVHLGSYKYYVLSIQMSLDNITIDAHISKVVFEHRVVLTLAVIERYQRIYKLYNLIISSLVL